MDTHTTSAAKKKFTLDVFWNFVGQIFPGILTLIFIPLLIKNYGDIRFGVLSLAWALLGYLSLFDFGVSRSLTHSVSQKLAHEKEHEINSDISSALWLTFTIGLIASFVFYMTSSLWIPLIFKNANLPKEEILNSIYWLFLGLPFTLSSTGLKGAFDAFGRFDISNLLRIPLSFITYGVPALISFYNPSVDLGILFIAISRIIALGIYIFFIFRIRPSFQLFIFKWNSIKDLLKFGSWLAVSNFISPLMYQVDRFFISAFIGVAAVTYYSTPIDLLTKLWIVPSAILSVTFPSISFSKYKNAEHGQSLYSLTQKLILFVITPCILFCILFSNEILSLWIQPEFAEKTHFIFEIIAYGILINCLAQTPYTFIQAWGFPNWTAKLHLVEFPIYALSFYFLVKYFGIIGASIAWTGRILFDSICLTFLAQKLNDWKQPTKWILALTVLTPLLIGLSEWLTFAIKLIFILSLSVIIIYLIFGTSLFKSERDTLIGLIKKRK